MLPGFPGGVRPVSVEGIGVEKDGKVTEQNEVGETGRTTTN